MLRAWACPRCQSDRPQVVYCCGIKVCEHSLFREKTIEEMTQHMIGKHGMDPPRGWVTLQQRGQKKAKRTRRGRNRNQGRRGRNKNV